MSTTRFIVPYSFIKLHINTSRSFQTFIFNPISHSAISKHKNKSYFPANGRLHYLSNGRRGQTDANTKRDFAAYTSVQPGGAPHSSGTPSNSWKHWILGMLISAVLPFLRHKLGPLFELSEKVENAVETADDIAEGIEKIAEQVEKVADEVGDELPEGGRLRKAFDYVENLAKEAAEDAHKVDEVLDKIDEVHDEVESFIHPVTDGTSERAEEANDKKSTT